MEVQRALDYYRASADQGRIFRKVVEGFASATAVLLGLTLLTDGYAAVSDVWYPLSVTMPSRFWAAIFVSLGMVRATVLVVNGWWPYSHLARKWISASFIMGLWMPLASCHMWIILRHLFDGVVLISPEVGYITFATGVEFFIFYAHTTFLHIAKKGYANE